MTSNISPLAGKPAPLSLLADIPKLITAYYSEIPDSKIPRQRVIFGTSGHRGSSLDKTFNEWHILAISQAICLYRKQQKIDGPLFLGIDTHALAIPAFVSALEVLAANNIIVKIANDDEYTPTPVISHAILKYNLGRDKGFADGIVITPSHNPPNEGGFKYNPPNGGPADLEITQWIQTKANEFLENNLKDINRIPYERALRASTTSRHDFLNEYVNDLENIIDMQAIRDRKLHMGVDPLGGAGVHYWAPIAERYNLDLNIVNQVVDPTFRFMTVDWDGQIRMDPSSPFAMERLIGMKDKYDISFACDTDYDRHGIVTHSAGLLPPNHYLSVAIFYLFQHRPSWNKSAGIGKTIVSSQMINRVTTKLGRNLFEVPVGFKWFVEGLLNSSLGFGGEESAGASFLRKDGRVWTTDKDGIILALLSAEITAVMGEDLGKIYKDLTDEFGEVFFDRTDAPATTKEKEILSKMTADQIHSKDLAGDKIESIITQAPGNKAAIGGIKVITNSGWFATRPSGTEDIYRIYAESFKDKEHLKAILKEAQMIIHDALNTFKE
jgi:phosphoglucomutase